MKAVLVIDKPKICLECPCYSFNAQANRFECNAKLFLKGKIGVVELDKKPNWCPLIHPLKEVSNDFYIYDTEYLFKNLDREIDLLKSTERFKEHMRNREK